MTCTHDTSAYNDAAHDHTAFGYRKGLAVQKMFSGRTFIDLCCDLEHSSPFLLLLLFFFHKRLKLTIMNCQTMFHSKKLNSSEDTLVQTVVSCCCGVFLFLCCCCCF